MVIEHEVTNFGNVIQGATINELPQRRPDNFIVGVIDNEQELVGAVSAVNSSGLTQGSVFVLFGEPGAEALRHRGEHTGTQRLFKWISNRLGELAGGELDSIQRHAEAAERGSYITGVQLSNSSAQQRDAVRDLLKRYGGYHIVLVKRNSISTLDA
jgi:hypothetical protein